MMVVSILVALFAVGLVYGGTRCEFILPILKRSVQAIFWIIAFGGCFGLGLWFLSLCL
jgi:hypothetical protein